MPLSVILAGGVGSRLWPLSREARPKQFLAFDERGSLLQQTWARLRRCLPAEALHVCTVERYADLVLEQLPELDAARLIVEPCGRGTGPTSAYVAAWLEQRHGPAAVAALAADGWVRDPEAFVAALETAFAAVEAQPQAVAALGIRPSKPATGFGYIRVEAGAGRDSRVLAALSFEEKPTPADAERYFRSGSYFWNASYFVWRTDRLLELFAEFQPEIAAGAAELRAAGLPDRPGEREREIFERMPRISVDHAVMEHARPLLVVPAAMGWTDLGSWASVAEVFGPGGGPLHVSVRDGRVFVVPDRRLVATLGLDNVAVVDTPDALLVCDLDRAEDLRDVTEELRARGTDHLL